MRRSAVESKEAGAASSGRGGCGRPVRGWISSPLSATKMIRLSLPSLPRTSREQVGHSVIVVVGPLLERMVVAMGALNGHAEKRHRDGLRHLLRIFVHGVEAGRPVLQRAAPRGDDLRGRNGPRVHSRPPVCESISRRPEPRWAAAAPPKRAAGRTTSRTSNRQTPAASAADPPAARAYPADDRRERPALRRRSANRPIVSRAGRGGDSRRRSRSATAECSAPRASRAPGRRSNCGGPSWQKCRQAAGSRKEPAPCPRRFCSGTRR